MIDANVNGLHGEVQSSQQNVIIGTASVYEQPVEVRMEGAQLGAPLNTETVQAVIDQGITDVDVQQTITTSENGQNLRPDAVNILRIFRGMFGGSVRLGADGSRHVVQPKYSYQSHSAMGSSQDSKI